MKKLKGIVLAVILLLASVMMPFDIYADTLSNSNVNINYYLESVTEISSGSYMQTYRVDFIFDQSYLGWISSKLVGTFVNNNSIPVTTSQFTYTKSIYVNGTTASTTVSFTTPNTISNGALQSLSQSLQNSNVTPLADLSTLDDILTVLNDINTVVSIDILGELQNIVANTELANDYLEQISLYRQWQFPIESYSFLSYWFSNNRELIDYYLPNNYYKFPRFKMNANQYIIQGFYVPADFNDVYVVLLLQTGSGSSTIQSLRTPAANNFEYTNISYFNDSVYGLSYLRLYHYWNLNVRNFYIQYPNDCYVTPIYIGYNTSYISTDFALQFGLSNRLLDDIHLISSGTSQSNSASSDLESGNSQMADDMNDLATIENGYNQQFNNQLQSIDFTSPIQNNAGILPAANFVISIFNGLINNNPFSVLIIIVCILLIGKKVIGK